MCFVLINCLIWIFDVKLPPLFENIERTVEVWDIIKYNAC
jgi:hypothetical protein